MRPPFARLLETITYSFMPAYYDRIRMPKTSPLRDSLQILNPLGEDSCIMRTVTLPSMLETVARNYNNRNELVRLYELAAVYLPSGEKLPFEKKVLTLGAYGDMDFFDMKGDVELILRKLRVKDIRFEAEANNPSYHPGQCAGVYSGGTLIGVFGQVHPSVAENYGMDVPVFAAELDFENILARWGRNRNMCRFPLPGRLKGHGGRMRYVRSRRQTA